MDRGVRRVVLPRVGSKSAARRKHERQRWFRRGQRWRVGSEGRSSVIKRRHKLDRRRYHVLRCVPSDTVRCTISGTAKSGLLVFCSGCT